jgi:hypothetical protein
VSGPMRFMLVWSSDRPRNGVMDESPAGNWVSYTDYDQISRRVAELEGALRFYADERRYRGANKRPFADDPYTKPDAAYANCMERDCGDIARAALKGQG